MKMCASPGNRNQMEGVARDVINRGSVVLLVKRLVAKINRLLRQIYYGLKVVN